MPIEENRGLGRKVVSPCEERFRVGISGECVGGDVARALWMIADELIPLRQIEHELLRTAHIPGKAEQQEVCGFTGSSVSE